MTTLCVNVDHVATLRQARGGSEPDPVEAARIVERAGSTGVTIHLREDRRHILDADVRAIRAIVRGHLNLEMAATEEMTGIALEVRPHIVTLVPERREERTTEGGLDVVGGGKSLFGRIGRLREAGIRVSPFIAPDERQIRASAESGAEEIELHTGPYCHAFARGASSAELDALIRGAALGRELGLVVNAGHGLNLRNVAPVAVIAEMSELNIGHSIVSRAVFVGLHEAVSEMAAAIRTACGGAG